MKGILFRKDMYLAAAAGRKTQTRRVGGLRKVNEAPDDWHVIGGFVFVNSRTGEDITVKPRYRSSEVAYVREPWCVGRDLDPYKPNDLACGLFPGQRGPIHWLHDGPKPEWGGRTRSPLHLPAAFARRFVRFKIVRCERLQDVTPVEIRAEGLPGDEWYSVPGGPEKWFVTTWDGINSPPFDWAGTPWVFVYEFELTEGRRA